MEKPDLEHERPENLDKEEQKYTDFSNVETMRNFLTAEEVPEGPYGSPINEHSKVVNKSTPWKPGQRYYTPFNYEFKSLHQNLPRRYPGHHPPHDDPNRSEEPPYDR
ncbi:cytosolic protein [bacterium LRH843]|nr:cytosolic protein [bacterium LRH843]